MRPDHYAQYSDKIVALDGMNSITMDSTEALAREREIYFEQRQLKNRGGLSVEQMKLMRTLFSDRRPPIMTYQAALADKLLRLEAVEDMMRGRRTRLWIEHGITDAEFETQAKARVLRGSENPIQGAVPSAMPSQGNSIEVPSNPIAQTPTSHNATTQPTQGRNTSVGGPRGGNSSHKDTRATQTSKISSARSAYSPTDCNNLGASQCQEHRDLSTLVAAADSENLRDDRPLTRSNASVLSESSDSEAYQPLILRYHRSQPAPHLGTTGTMVEKATTRTEPQREIPEAASGASLMNAGYISRTRVNDGSTTHLAQHRCTQEELDKADILLDVAEAGLSSDDEHFVRHPSLDSDATEVLEGGFEGERQRQLAQKQNASNNRTDTTARNPQALIQDTRAVDLTKDGSLSPSMWQYPSDPERTWAGGQPRRVRTPSYSPLSEQNQVNNTDIRGWSPSDQLIQTAPTPPPASRSRGGRSRDTGPTRGVLGYRGAGRGAGTGLVASTVPSTQPQSGLVEMCPVHPEQELETRPSGKGHIVRGRLWCSGK